VDDGGFLERQGRLSGGFECERVFPREGDFDLGESQLEQLQLAKVLVQQISGYEHISKLQGRQGNQLTRLITAGTLDSVLATSM
jgi:hypothetical protein